MESFPELISRWPTITEMADDLGVGYPTAAGMKWRGWIASRHWPKLLEAAERRGWADVTSDRLTKFIADRTSAA